MLLGPMRPGAGGLRSGLRLGRRLHGGLPQPERPLALEIREGGYPFQYLVRSHVDD
uniref:Uncharacterized protein n=1 Tax=blood disease bacterium R229 TaxID=741978 RepID=G2ZST7_9RALS|nr:conserved hypothetical protein [blood disease bacterium R229]